MTETIDLENTANRWLARDPDPLTKTELTALLEDGNQNEIAQRFSSRLAFGTAGLRGVVGAGPARMNRLVIRETSAGLGNYLSTHIASAVERGVLIAYDGRLDSKQFSEDAACVFTGLGFKVYLTDRVTPTPVGAFGINKLNCAAGVVVTASHNPPEYNGYKVYWENGAQITSPHDQGIAAAIDDAAANTIPWLDFTAAKKCGKIILLDDKYCDDYYHAISTAPLFQVQKKSVLPTITVAYSAMHGVGAVMAERLLKQTGFCDIYSVASQREPDGHFPTVKFPNPEEPGAMDAVIAEAKQHNATLACANDPDADRLAVAVQTENGEYKMLSGDQIGVLLGAYLLGKQNRKTPIVCTTIVSSSMLQKVAEGYGAQYHETLTGFKWLANVARQQEQDDCQFLFAYEEALGYAVGRTVWDKDGLSALLAFVQMTAELASNNKNVLDELEHLYTRFGLHVTLQKSIALKADAAPIGDVLREKPLSSIAGKPIAITEDIQQSVRHFADGHSEAIDLPTSDALIYRTADGVRVIVRPSGTEPKLKCYYELARAPQPINDFIEFEQQSKRELKALAETFQNELLALMN